MFIARILYPVEVLGPGKRVSIWFDGCPRRCFGCSNPDLWETQERYQITLPRIEELIATIALNHPIEGFTITGGEPFWQPEALWELLTVIRKYTEDVLVYSGYTFDELLRLNSTEINNCLKNIAVLIDGVYIDELNDGSVLRGSSNQMIRILNERYSSLYEQYLSKAANEIQNFMIGNSVISVGIHRKNFAIDLVTAKAQKGLVEEE